MQALVRQRFSQLVFAGEKLAEAVAALFGLLDFPLGLLRA